MAVILAVTKRLRFLLGAMKCCRYFCRYFLIAVTITATAGTAMRYGGRYFLMTVKLP